MIVTRFRRLFQSDVTTCGASARPDVSVGPVSGLYFFFLLLALFQERWRLELLFLLGRRLARRALWGPALRFDWRRGGSGGVVGRERLHPFLQFFSHLLLLVPSVLKDRRVVVYLHCCNRRLKWEQRKHQSKQACTRGWSLVLLRGCMRGMSVDEHACLKDVGFQLVSKAAFPLPNCQYSANVVKIQFCNFAVSIK